MHWRATAPGGRAIRGGDASEERWSWGDRVAFALLALGVVVSLPLFAHSWYDLDNDAATYILTARALVAGEGYSLHGEPFLARPPGLSLLIAPILALRGTDFAALNAFSSLFGAAGVLALFALARPRLGGPLAAGCAALVWLNPSYQQFSHATMSDVPGSALALGCLLLERAASRRPSWRGELALGLAIGLSCYVRSFLVLLVPAVAVARAVRELERPRAQRRWRGLLLQRVLPLAALVALLLAPWELRNAAVAPPPPADQAGHYDYATAMWHLDRGDPRSPRVSLAKLERRMERNEIQVAAALGSGLATREWSARRGALGVLLLLGLAACALARREAPELFAWASLGLFVVYFQFVPRLAVPVFVLALPAAADAALRALRPLAGRSAPALVGAALLAGISAQGSPRERYPSIEASYRRMAQRAADAAALIAPGSRVASAYGWHYAVLLERPVWSLTLAVQRAGTAQGAEAVLDKYGIDTVVLSTQYRRERDLLPYFMEHYPERETRGSVTAFRVRPGPR